MLARAFLMVAALTEHAHRPPPEALIPMTCNELQHLFAARSCSPLVIAPTGCAGRCGDADVKLPSGNHEDEGHDLWRGLAWDTA
jgi:hypothetical protein